MPLKSTPTSYGTIPIVIHWLTALAILILLVSGFRAADMADSVAKAGLLRIHVILGVSVLLLTVARIAWWLLIDRRPADAAGTPRLQAIAAHAVHGLLYLVVLAMAASGIGMVAVSGAGDILFGGSGPTLPDFMEYVPRIPHGVGARALIALIVLHTAAALYHQFFLRDRLLARMGIGRA